MATKRIAAIEGDKWGILFLIFGFVGIIEQIPIFFRKFCVSKIIPKIIKKQLLAWNTDAEFWMCLLFLVLITVVCLIVGVRLSVSESLSESYDSVEENKNRILKAEKILKYKRMFFSLGLIPLRELILSKMGIEIYGTFRRPRTIDWSNKVCFDCIDILDFSDGSRIEYQYARDYRNLMRRTLGNHGKYLDPSWVSPSSKDIKLLLVASNFFPFWFIMYLKNRFIDYLSKIGKFIELLQDVFIGVLVVIIN